MHAATTAAYGDRSVTHQEKPPQHGTTAHRINKTNKTMESKTMNASQLIQIGNDLQSSTPTARAEMMARWIRGFAISIVSNPGMLEMTLEDIENIRIGGPRRLMVSSNA